MTGLLIRDLDPAMLERLRVRAAGRGHSPEEEARRILNEALAADPANAFDRLRRHFVDVGDGGFDLPPRSPGREPPAFE